VHVDVRRVDELASEGMSLHVHTCFRSIELWTFVRSPHIHGLLPPIRTLSERGMECNLNLLCIF
jgi:hypothetical protein